MTLSGWTRLWIVASLAVAACSPADPAGKKPAIAVTEARLWQLKAACKDFQYNVRKDWEVQVSDPVLVEERAAIDQMKRACTDFERELWDQGLPVF